ncbi:MAG: hypothetical protein RXQ95_09035 [Vulcanisaeta sp.]
MNSPARVNFTLKLIVLILAITSVIIIIANSIYAVPSLVAYSSIGPLGEVGYYASQPVPGVPPGLLVRVFLINGSVVEPVRAFIDIYANAPNGIVRVAMDYSQSLVIPFNNTNWQYVIGKWASLNVPFSDYETSMLIFITYVKGNESWIVPLVIPYNAAWAIENSRYIVVNALINVNELRPNKVVPAMPGTTAVNLQLPSNHSDYTTYNCNLNPPKPLPEITFKPEIVCLGLNGSLPIAWATWGRDALQSDSGLVIDLSIYFSGTINWNAMAVGYGVIGTSYSAKENWGPDSSNFILGSEVTQPGSVYWYYGNATWAIVNYEVYYVDTYSGNYYQVGTTTVSEVLYAPPNDYYAATFDYGSGMISMFYNGAIPVSKQYFGYPVLNASTVVDYAAFEYDTVCTGECLLECNGPVGNTSTVFNGVQYTLYTVTLGGVEQAYGLSAAELGTGLGGLVLGISSMLTAQSTSTSVTSASLGIGNVTTGTNLHISVIDASKTYGLPAFGFILNATNFYGNPTTYTCKYGKVTQIG